MRRPRRLVKSLRAIDRRAPDPVRRFVRAGRDVARRTGRELTWEVAGRRGDSRLVTVVVTVSAEDLDYLDEAMESVVGQAHRDLEILVVPYGPEGRQVRAALARWTRSDYAVHIMSAQPPDLAAARDRGARAAHGRYLAFLRGHDVLPAKAIRDGVAALQRSDSDFVIGRVSNPTSVMRSILPRDDRVHDRRRYGVTLREFPAAVADSGLGNRLFSSAFWRRSRLTFAGARGESDVVLAAFQHAVAFDVITSTTYRPRNRAFGTPVEQLYDSTADLSAWLSDASTTRRRLRTLESTIGAALLDHWATGVIDHQLQTFLGDAERMTDEQWQALRSFTAGLLEAISDRAWSQTRAESRVKLRLLLADRRPALERFVADRWFEQDNVLTRVDEGGVYAEFPLDADAASVVDATDLAFAEHETPARVRVRNVRIVAADRLAVDVLARIQLVDLSDITPEVTARWLGYDDEDKRDDSIEPVPTDVIPVEDPQANMSIGHRYQDYRRGGFRVESDLSRLTTGRWRLEVTVRVGTITRSTDAMSFDNRGSAGLIGSRYQPRRVTVAGPTVAVKRGGGRLELVVRDAEPVRLVSAQVDGRRVQLRLRSRDGRSVESVVADAGPRHAAAGLKDGIATLDLPSPTVDSPRAWKLRAITDQGSHPIAWPAEPEPSLLDGWLGVGDGSVVVTRSEYGNAMLYESERSAILDDVDLAAGRVVVRGRWLGAEPADDAGLRLTARGSRCETAGAISTAADGSFTADIPLRWTPWGLDERLVPRDEYLFFLTDNAIATGEETDEPSGFAPELHVSAAFIDGMLSFRLTDEVRMRPICKPSRAPGFALSVPIPVADSGAYAQYRLQQQALSDPGPIDEQAVYLLSYNGSVATDSPAAIHQELRRRHPELKLYWGVNDPSTPLPEGGIPVLVNSPEWYRIVTTAAHLVQNVDFPRWWRKRPEQRFLQTFHGYPAKSMGLRMWRAKKFTPLRQQIELERTSAGWDLILTPAPAMDVHYRQEYDYAGPIENRGYPRDDALLDDRADQWRQEVRERLGIRPDQKVLLYAPTWRDHLASSYTSAAIVEYLDVDAASEALGDEYVFLLRGHRFNTKRPDRGWDAARILDVTDYPEINDLILASDVAVLDYSSLRFDFALTGRPMVFLVPDLADYTGGIRGFLFDYADSAPGPLLNTTDEVIAAVRDLKALSQSYRGQLAAFNAKYQYLQDGRAAERVVGRFFSDRQPEA
ncbi:CDP-glycerol glycerophosphotransferase family protein [Microlunatus soli]|uniref:CDP-glycerol glycerophosphotransferase n=1 Tax=Microlunatus soli TaxID=630515 RepID=A0A1H2A8W9_9ACTN|nr:CDP-glycerol glycerophosphotransferase family protein [Microlunatus soli]SDT42425.1 CDP-glycerol glycerophosphotransferase [Microlunatus soli]